MARRNHPHLIPLRRRAALLLWAEALIIALSPACATLLCYVFAALIGLSNPYLFTAILLLATGLLMWGLWRLRAPGPAAIDRRIETASRLSHRPFSDLADTPENDDPAALELWQAHQARISQSLAAARTGPLTLNAATRDKLALRALLMLALTAGLVIAGAAAPSRITGALALPPWPFPGPRITAWVTPPSYTGAAPRILRPGEPITTLTGATLTIITDGPHSAPRLHFGHNKVSTTNLSNTSHRADAAITTSATATLGPWWHRLASWHITATPPAAPSIQITTATVLHDNIIKLTWHAADPYGLKSLILSFSPVGNPNALPLIFPLNPHTGDNSIIVDVTRSPFSGAPVSLAITATNIAGVTTADSPAQTFTVPGLQPHDKTAQALITTRRIFASNPATAQQTAATLQQIAAAPLSRITASADVQIASLATSIQLGAITAPDIVNHLLALAMEIEAGPDYNAARQLAESNNALTRALAQGLNGHPPSTGELQKLLNAMHEAANAHIGALQTAASQPGQQIDLSSLDKLAQQIAADEAAGNLQKAAQELEQLQQTLTALQNAQPMTAAQLAQAQAANQAAQSIAQMTQNQATLLDATHAGTASPADQTALQQQLQATQQTLAAAGLQIPGLTPANTAMQAAQAALASHATQNAAAAEAAAIKNLQQAAAALAQAAKRQFAIGPGGQPGSQSGSSSNPDGLTGSPDEQSDPDFNPNRPNPAAAIQQQIIQQDSQPALPAATHQYYHKLLDPAP